MYRWLSWLGSGFHAAHYPFFMPFNYVPDASLYEKVSEHSATGIRDALGFLNRHLSGRRHMFLERPTLLDPYVFTMARWSAATFDYAADFPAVHAFLERMKGDGGVRFALDVEKGEGVDRAGDGGAFPGHVDFETAVKAVPTRGHEWSA